MPKLWLFYEWNLVWSNIVKSRRFRCCLKNCCLRSDLVARQIGNQTRLIPHEKEANVDGLVTIAKFFAKLRRGHTFEGNRSFYVDQNIVVYLYRAADRAKKYSKRTTSETNSRNLLHHWMFECWVLTDSPKLKKNFIY